jgi:asparagine synthase (glutamine-hydrolysing)
MCGIFGIVNLKKSHNFNLDLFEQSLMKMKHRGPDAMGIKAFTDYAILGHVRLSILDLDSASNQPFQI